MNGTPCVLGRLAAVPGRVSRGKDSDGDSAALDGGRISGPKRPYPKEGQKKPWITRKLGCRPHMGVWVLRP